MPRLSVVLASRNERFLNPTLRDIFTKAAGDVEAVVVLDGAPPVEPLPEDPRLKIVAWPLSHGLRAAINAGMATATGTFLMKLDAHCRLEEGYDDILTADCDDDWLVIPRRRSLEAETWTIARVGKAPIDYEYLSWYLRDLDAAVRPGNVWKARQIARDDVPIDDDMSFQGSCYVLRKAYWEHLGPLVDDRDKWGTFVLEPEELGNKVWLSGGRVVINKRTQYAHLHKGKIYGRGFFMDRRALIRGRRFNANFWMTNSWLPQWPQQQHPFEWLIDRFWPVPTWPEDWRAYLGPIPSSGAAAGQVAARPDELQPERTGG